MEPAYAVYMSYARIDDEIAPGANVPPWVSAIFQRLALRLRHLTGLETPVFMDRYRIMLEQDWPSEIENAFNHSRVLLVVLSSSYLASPYCLKELDAFIESRRAGAAQQLFVIETQAIDRDKLPAVLRDIKGYPFWKGNSRLSPEATGFNRLIDQLAMDIRNQIDSQPKTVETSSTAVMVSDTGIRLVEEKRSRGEYDVFLCHNSLDKEAVKEIAKLLMREGLNPWLDEWELQPGRKWQTILETRIDEIKSAAVIVGKSGLGPWQNMELDSFLRAFVERQCPVIPVILSSCAHLPKLPMFLRGLTWVDFRISTPDPVSQLVWGISGKRPTFGNI